MAIQRIQTERRFRTRGLTLLEVVMAVAITGIALVGALEMLSDGMDLGERIDNQLLLTNYGVSTLESQLALVAHSWTEGTTTGSFAADGHSSIRYSVTRSDSAMDGGIEDRLMHVQVVTYVDANGSGTLDAGEQNCSFRTKIGKYASYEAL